MKLIYKDVKTKEEASEFILSCENTFENKLRQTARDILLRGNKLITLSGPTCSGKTTTAKILVEEIERKGHSAVVISIDDFYLNDLRDGLASGQKVDFDSVKTIDLDYLASFTNDLLEYKKVNIPIFDFKTGRRVGYEEYTPSHGDIFIFEGIQAVYPEVTSLFGDRYTSVFICVNDEVMCNGVYFSPHEIRLLRRIVRDNLFRNTTPETTLMCWEAVRENENTAIFPNAGNPDFPIDSFMLYELFMISGIIIPLLKEIPCDSKYKSDALSLCIRLEKLYSDKYVTDQIPGDSMFREFIGNWQPE